MEPKYNLLKKNECNNTRKLSQIEVNMEYINDEENIQNINIQGKEKEKEIEERNPPDIQEVSNETSNDVFFDCEYSIN